MGVPAECFGHCDLQKQMASEDGNAAKGKVPELPKEAAKKPEGKTGKPSLGLKVKLKKAKAPEHR